MLNIKNLVEKNISVPMEHREVKREEFGDAECRVAKHRHLH